MSEEKATIAYDRYAPLFECYIQYYDRYERVYAVLGYSVKLGALITQAIATLLHLQPDDSLLFGSYATSKQMGYIFGFVAVFLAGLSSLLPFEQSSSRYRYAAAIMGRYLTTHEPLPRSDIHKIYDIDSIFLPSISSYRECRLAEVTTKKVERKQNEQKKVKPAKNTYSASGTTRLQGKIESIPFTEYASLLLCANTGFKTYSTRFLRIHYVIATIQLVFTASTAVFHGDISTVLQVSKNDLNTVATFSGIIGTITSAIISVVPLKDVGERCMRAHSIINEYIISEDELPNTVLEQLYATPTLWHKNPLLVRRCLQFVDADV